MAESTGEEIKIGGLAIRFLLEGEASGGSVAMFEFDVSAGAVNADRGQVEFGAKVGGSNGTGTRLIGS